MLTQSPRRGRSLRAIAPLLLVSAAFGLTACGGDDAKTTTAASATGASGSASRGANGADRTALQACLKKQGVTLPERPAGGPGNGYGGTPPTGTDGAPPTPPEGQDGTPPAGGDGQSAPPAGGQGGAAGGLPGSGRAGGARGGRQLSEADRKKLMAAMQKCGGQIGPGAAGGGGRGQRPDVDDAAYRKSITAYVACVRKHGFDLPDPNFSGKGPIFDAKKVDQQDAIFQKASAACQSELRPDRGRSAPTTTATTPGTTS
jgi:hypothetical protein